MLIIKSMHLINLHFWTYLNSNRTTKNQHNFGNNDSLQWTARELPYKKETGSRRKFWKQPIRGLGLISFFFSPLRGINSKTNQIDTDFNFWLNSPKIPQKLLLWTFLRMNKLGSSKRYQNHFSFPKRYATSTAVLVTWESPSPGGGAYNSVLILSNFFSSVGSLENQVIIMYIAPVVEVFGGNSYPVTSVLNSISSQFVIVSGIVWRVESILQLIWGSVHQYCSKITRSQWITVLI